MGGGVGGEDHHHRHALDSRATDHSAAAAAGGASGPLSGLPAGRGTGPHPQLQFARIHWLVLRGLLSPLSHDATVDLLSLTASPHCDALFGAGPSRLITFAACLLPWLCLRLPDAWSSAQQEQQEQTGSVQAGAGVGAGSGIGDGGEGSGEGVGGRFQTAGQLQQRWQGVRARSMAKSMAQWCATTSAMQVSGWGMAGEHGGGGLRGRGRLRAYV